MHNENLLLDQEQEVDIINSSIRQARKFKLEGEVVRSAMQHMQDNPLSSVSEALHFALQEYGI